MKLHESLAELARDHGQGLFRDAAAFRGSLDDYLDEGQASSGTINLLTDAVRLGALDGMLTMLDSGATPADAVDSAGQRLARDRGSADVRGCQWALSVLGFALSKVPENLVIGLDPDAGTTSPPAHGPRGTAPAQPPYQSPPHQPVTSPVAPAQQPIVSPMQQPGQPGIHPVAGSYGAAPSYGSPQQSYGAGGGWSQPTPPKKGNAALIIGGVVLALVVIIGGIIGIVALSGDDDDDPKADDSSSATEGTDETDETDTTSGPDETDGPNGDLGGPTINGLGYSVSTPQGWNDGTDEFARKNPNLTTLDKIFWWGDSFTTARGNIIVETQNSFGQTDPEGLKDDWKEALTQSDDTADPYDLPDVMIDGQKALTVEIDRPSNNVKQRAHLVISGDKGYSITVTYRNGDADVPNAFEEILDTWKWTN